MCTYIYICILCPCRRMISMCFHIVCLYFDVPACGWIFSWPHCDVTGMVIHKGNHPTIALFYTVNYSNLSSCMDCPMAVIHYPYTIHISPIGLASTRRHLEGCQTLGRLGEGPVRNVHVAPRSEDLRVAAGWFVICQKGCLKLGPLDDCRLNNPIPL